MKSTLNKKFEMRIFNLCGLTGCNVSLDFLTIYDLGNKVISSRAFLTLMSHFPRDIRCGCRFTKVYLVLDF